MIYYQMSQIDLFTAIIYLQIKPSADSRPYKVGHIIITDLVYKKTECVLTWVHIHLLIQLLVVLLIPLVRYANGCLYGSILLAELSIELILIKRCNKSVCLFLVLTCWQCSIPQS